MPYTAYSTWNGYNIIPAPTVPPNFFQMTKHDQVAVTESPFTGAQYTYSFAGADTLRATIGWAPLTQAQYTQVDAWLAALRGRQNIFYYGDPTPRSNQGTPQFGSGYYYAVTTGTSSVGQTVITSTQWKPSTTKLLMPGDHIFLGVSGGVCSCHTVIQQVDSDSSGNATIEIYPSIRFAISTYQIGIGGYSATTPSYQYGGCYWRLKSNDRNWSYDAKSRLYTLPRFEIQEVR
jgi:hypothetical protein